jgi:hypothetical protein
LEPRLDGISRLEINHGRVWVCEARTGSSLGAAAAGLARQAAGAYQRSSHPNPSRGIRGVRVEVPAALPASRDGAGATAGESFGVAVVTRHGPSCFLLAQDLGHPPTASDDAQQWLLGAPERRRPLVLRYAAFSPEVQAALELKQ